MAWSLSHMKANRWELWPGPGHIGPWAAPSHGRFRPRWHSHAWYPTSVVVTWHHASLSYKWRDVPQAIPTQFIEDHYIKIKTEFEPTTIARNDPFLSQCMQGSSNIAQVMVGGICLNAMNWTRRQGMSLVEPSLMQTFLNHPKLISVNIYNNI